MMALNILHLTQSVFYFRFEPLTEDETLLETVLSELTCPVCDVFMIRPIHQCVNGHSLCDECFEEVDKCPTCRGRKSAESRSVALEYISDEVVLPCRYREHGCQHVCLGKHLRNHQKFCSFVLQPCLFWYCRWFGCKHDLTTHLSRSHSYNFYEDAQVTFTAGKFFDNAEYREASYCFIIYAYEEFFLLAWGLDFRGEWMQAYDFIGG